MKKLPSVVIIGRPNVGKSSLFNRILKRRAAVVSDREGVTRDRHFQNSFWNGRNFQIVDTGGYIMDETIDELAESVRDQILTAVQEADKVIFMVDARVGLTSMDEQFAQLVKRGRSEFILVANKAEKEADKYQSYEFYKLGMGDPIPVSATVGSGMGDLMDIIVEGLPEEDELEEEEMIRFAILGRPNAGKSTLLNQIIGEERSITSDIAGTTRDSIEAIFNYHGRQFKITDTAGLRKKARVNDEVEYFSNMRSLESIRRSDVCILMVDVNEKIGVQDMRILSQIQDNNKGLIVVLNKWDTVDKADKTYDHLVKELKAMTPELQFVPFLSISALTGQRANKVIDEVVKVYDNCFRVLGRDRVVQVFEDAVAANPHPSRHSKRIKMTRACQILVNPPVVTIECSNPELVDESWKRYMRRKIFNAFDLSGAPLKLNFDQELRLRKDEELEHHS